MIQKNLAVRIVVFFFGLIAITIIFQSKTFAQIDSVYSIIHGRKYSPFVEYRATAAKISDLVHTRLAVSFDYDKA